MHDRAGTLYRRVDNLSVRFEVDGLAECFQRGEAEVDCDAFLSALINILLEELNRADLIFHQNDPLGALYLF